MVEFCIEIGQEHLEDIPKLFDTDVVHGFKCESDMMATMWHLNVATIWQGKPLILCSLPLKGRQVKDYTVVRGGHSSGAHAYIQGRGAGIWPLPNVPSLGKDNQRPQCPCPRQN